MHTALACPSQLLPVAWVPNDESLPCCRSCDWHEPEVYVLLVLDIIFAYNALMLFFGLAHCCSLLCGACMLYLVQSTTP